MRIIFFISFILFSGKLFAQSAMDTTRHTDSLSLNLSTFKPSDSLKFIFPTKEQTDSLGFLVPSTTNFITPSNNPGPIYLGVIPNCSLLNLRGDLFYLSTDSIPYCGQCVVLYDENKSSITYVNRYGLGDNFYAYYSQYLTVVDRVKIVSNYVGGKREGAREYYNEQGELVKTEFYNNGVLTETIYNIK